MIKLLDDRITLIHGDCLDIMSTLESNSIDLICADLPYGTTACKWDIVIPFDQLWDVYNKLIYKTSPVLLFSTQPFTSILITSNIKNYRYNWYWRKNKTTGHMNAKKKQPLRAFEDICVFYKKQPLYNPQFKTGKMHGTFGSRNIDTTPIYGKQSKLKPKFITDTYYPNNELLFNVDYVNRLHPTQKPVALLEYLIKTYTNEGDLVLDNTMGSGTTAIACINTNRKFIGIELDKEYFDIAVDRCEKHIHERIDKV